MATATEKVTGVQFPLAFNAPGSGKALKLIGCGFRERKIAFVSVKIYAVSCHVEAAPAKAALAAVKPKDKQADKALLAGMQGGTFDTCLTLSFVREISQDQFASSVKDDFEPKLKAKGVPVPTVDAFISAFTSQDCSKGSRIFLNLQGTDKLAVSGVKAVDVPASLCPPDGTSATTIESKDLVSVFKENYFGQNSTVPSLKAAVIEAVASL